MKYFVVAEWNSFMNVLRLLRRCRHLGEGGGRGKFFRNFLYRTNLSFFRWTHTQSKSLYSAMKTGKNYTSHSRFQWYSCYNVFAICIFKGHTNLSSAISRDSQEINGNTWIERTGKECSIWSSTIQVFQRHSTYVPYLFFELRKVF